MLKAPLYICLLLVTAACHTHNMGQNIAQQHVQKSPLTEHDFELIDANLQKALNTLKDNERLSWSNPRTNNKGEFTTTGTITKNGKKCRSFIHNLQLNNGQTSAIEDIACKSAEGKWYFAEPDKKQVKVIKRYYKPWHHRWRYRSFIHHPYDPYFDNDIWYRHHHAFKPRSYYYGRNNWFWW